MTYSPSLRKKPSSLVAAAALLRHSPAALQKPPPSRLIAKALCGRASRRAESRKNRAPRARRESPSPSPGHIRIRCFNYKTGLHPHSTWPEKMLNTSRPTTYCSGFSFGPHPSTEQRNLASGMLIIESDGDMRDCSQGGELLRVVATEFIV